MAGAGIICLIIPVLHLFFADHLPNCRYADGVGNDGQIAGQHGGYCQQRIEQSQDGKGDADTVIQKGQDEILAYGLGK